MFCKGFRLFLFLICAASLAACDSSSKDKAAKAAVDNAVPVTVTTLIKKVIPVQHTSVGSIVSIENPVIKAETVSQVRAVHVHAGDEVFQGQLLGRLGDRRQQIAYTKAKANVAAAKAKLEESTFEQERYQILLKKHVVSELHYKQVVTKMHVAKQQLAVAEAVQAEAQHNVERTEIRSPIFGHVQHVYVSAGGFVKPGDKLFMLINRDVLQARLPFSEKQASKLQVGQQVHLFSPTSPNKLFEGTVSAIEPSINPNNRSLDVIVDFNRSDLLRVGASTRAKVYLDEEQTVYIVPRNSVILRDQGNVIFTLNKGKAVQHAVAVVTQLPNDKLAVKGNGLTAGSQLVIEGAPYLSTGTKVTVKNQKPKTKPKTP